MKSDCEIRNDIYNHIIGSELQLAVSGVVRKTKRPRNSQKEDIVVSVLANMNGQKQVATANVNIYVPDLIINDQAEEDTIRTAELCKLAESLFEVFRGDDFRASLLEQRVYEVDGADVHVINNKIEYKQINE